MSHRNIATASIVLLPLLYLIILFSLGFAAAQTITINQLVTSGQSVTLQAPAGNYLYQWSANWDGAQKASGTSQKFVFTAPTVTQEVGQKAITVFLLVRSVDGGCTNQTSGSFNVYSLPVCGIGGPATVGPYDSSTYTYAGGTTGTLTWQWDVDGTKLVPSSPNFVLDWTPYAPGNHTIGLTLTKDYSSVAAGSTNPLRAIVCKYPVNMTYTSGLAVTKTPSRTTAAVGQAVTYNYGVTNTGTISIKSIALSDSKLGPIPLSINTLKPGATTSASVTYTINETDLPGPLSNNVTVTGNEDKTNKQVRATASATISLTYKAALNITKIPSPTTAGVGQTVTYTYTTKNSGNVTVHDLVLSDSKVGPITLTQTTLAPGASTTATKSYTVLETDLPGPLNNTVTATATDSQNVAVPAAKATAIVPLRYAASMSVTKVASITSAGVGQTVTYTYTVKNTGNVTVHDLALSDSRLGSVTSAQAMLAPDASTTATASYVVKETDLPGPLVDSVNATSKDILGAAVPTAKATASVALRYAASMSVAKVPSITTAGVGQTVTYTYTVKNTGNVTVHDLALSDSRLGTVTPGQTTLAPDASTTATVTYVAKETDLPGPLSNTVTATATDILSVVVSNTATAAVELTYTAALSLTKVPSVATANAGETVTYTFGVENTGDVTINSLALSDPKVGPLTPAKSTLAPRESTTATADYVVKEEDLPGPLNNTVTATAMDRLGLPVPPATKGPTAGVGVDSQVVSARTSIEGVSVPSAEATATVSLRYVAGLSVAITPSSETVKVGDTITYTFRVENTGKVTVHDLALSDSQVGHINLTQTTLAPGKSATATATYLVKETVLPGPLSSTVAAMATDSQNKPVSSTATAKVGLTYTAALSMTKIPSVAAANVGQTVTYTFTVTNTGNVTVNGLALSDPKVGPITLTQTTLAPGASTTATASYTVKKSDLGEPLSNTVAATATDSQGKTVSATASATVLTTRAEIDPIVECVFDNGDGTFTVFFGYDNKNDYSLDIPVGKNNRFTSPPDDQGQPTTFEPGRHESVLAVLSKEGSLDWHLDVTDATADKDSPGCSKASCGLDGATDLCLNKIETYTYTSAEDPKFRQTYDWSIAGRSAGTGKSIDLPGAGFELGNYTLSMKVTRYLLDKVWSENFCNMSVRVTPTPSAEIIMEEQPV